MQPTMPTFVVFCLWMLNAMLLMVIGTATGYCPSPCHCRDANGAVEVNCESKSLNHVPLLKRKSERPMAGIFLGHNNIDTVYSNTFGGIESKYIFLSGNPLSIIAHDAFSHIRQLHLLDLENCGLEEVNFYPKFSSSTLKYYLNLNRNKISKIAPDFVSDVVRRSVSDGKKFYIELERNKIKTINFLGDICRIRQAHLVQVNVKENPLVCDCNLHTDLLKAGDRLKLIGRCSTPKMYKNDPINVFMEKGRIHCNRTCFESNLSYDCGIQAWSYGANKTCRALPVCKNGIMKCFAPIAGSVRTGQQSGSRIESSSCLVVFVFVMTSLLWIFRP